MAHVTNSTRQKDSTLRQVDGEMTALESRLQQARDALDAYREKHDIVSAKREENAVLAQLEGLNRALNDAVAEEVRTGAYLETLPADDAPGEDCCGETEGHSIPRHGGACCCVLVLLNDAPAVEVGALSMRGWLADDAPAAGTDRSCCCCATAAAAVASLACCCQCCSWCCAC